MTEAAAGTVSGRPRSLELRERTVQFAEDVVAACRCIPMTFEGRHVANQLFRASTSVAANYRAAHRARSRKEFIAKIGLVIEEGDESRFWLNFAVRINLLSEASIGGVLNEADQLVAIFYATRRTALARLDALSH
jgi:four helix bundle protein